MPKIITFATLKGGTGKTMNLFNIAGILAEKHKVLLVDIDPQCNLSSNCGIDVADTDIFTIRDIFEHPRKDEQPHAEDIIIHDPIRNLPNIDIIPSSILLFQIEDALVVMDSRSKILYNFFNRNKKYLSVYDYILIDTNPSLSVFNLNACYAADSIVLCSDISANSIRGAELFCSLWDAKRVQIDEDKEDNIAALLISNYSRRTRMAKDLMDYISVKDFSKDLILKTTIPATVKLKETETKHKPINLLYRTSPVCQAYRDVVEEMLKEEVL